MMPKDIDVMYEFITEIENLTSNPVIRAKCMEAKTYIKLLSGVVKETV